MTARKKTQPPKRPAITTKSKRTQQERRAASDEQLLKSAVGLIARRGSNFSLAEVGRCSGFSHAMAGARFGSRAEFIRNIRMTIRQQSYDTWEPHASARRPTDAFDAYLDWVSHADEGGRALYILLTEALTLESPDRADYAEHNLQLRQAFEQSIDETRIGKHPREVNTETIAIVLVGMLRGIAIQWLLEGDAIDLEKVRATARWILEKALGQMPKPDDRPTARARSPERT
jgi:hypothetical protein